MKYIHKQTNEVAVSAEFNEKFKTYLLTLEDGKTKNCSASTFKRWWKKVEDNSAVELSVQVEPAVPVVEEDTCGDGTPYSQVMQEIIKGAKKGAEKGVKKTVRNEVADKTFEDVLEVLKTADMEVKLYDKLPRFALVKWNGNSEFEVKVTKNGITLYCKEDDAKNVAEYSTVSNYYRPAVIKAGEDFTILSKLINIIKEEN